MMDSMVCYFHSYMVMRWSTVTCTGMVVILPVLMLTGVSKDPLSIWRRNTWRVPVHAWWRNHRNQTYEQWNMHEFQSIMPPKAISYFLYSFLSVSSCLSVRNLQSPICRCWINSPPLQLVVRANLFTQLWGNGCGHLALSEKGDPDSLAPNGLDPWDIAGPCKFFTAVSVSRMFRL